GTANGGSDTGIATATINLYSNHAPTGSVTIAGTVTEDQVLTASNTLADADGMGPVSYQWQRNASDIAGVTASTYPWGDGDVPATPRRAATYPGAADGGNDAGIAAATINLYANHAPTGSVTIAGTATEDQVLTASNTLADADGMGPVSYQWQ